MRGDIPKLRCLSWQKTPEQVRLNPGLIARMLLRLFIKVDLIFSFLLTVRAFTTLQYYREVSFMLPF